MIEVICIGTYDSNGEFKNVFWDNTLLGLSTVCNSVIVYTEQEQLFEEFNKVSEVIELQSPEPSMGIHAFRLDVFNNDFWGIINNYNYNIDTSNSISHIYFMKHNNCIAWLEVTDYENFVIFDLQEDIKKEMNNCDFFNEHYQDLNSKVCMSHREDINSLLDGDSWRPLNVNRT